MHFRSIVNSFVNRNGLPVYILTGKLCSRTESFKTSKQQLRHSPHNFGAIHLQHLPKNITLNLQIQATQRRTPPLALTISTELFNHEHAEILYRSTQSFLTEKMEMKAKISYTSENLEGKIRRKTLVMLVMQNIYERFFLA